MLENLAVVLVRPRFPENIGSVARACLNMGVSRLVLVSPENFDLEKAAPLATVHARHILERAVVVPDLATALAPFQKVFGTTARTGGWRKAILTPAQAGGMVRDALAGGELAALVFGPEDKGMTNEETTLCGRLVTIPTAPECSSLNLAQAALVLLYEAFGACREKPFDRPPDKAAPERTITHAEEEALFSAMREALLAIDFLQDDNPDYWLLPLRRFFTRLTLRRAEFNLIMGICRQVRHISRRACEAGSPPASD